MARGPSGTTGTPSCSSTGTGATSSTATATGGTTRSSPTSTRGVTTSTSPWRTGDTTSTSDRSSARRTPWAPRPFTSSASAGGTVAAPWSPTGTSTSTTTRTLHRWPSGRGPRVSSSSASTTCPDRSRSRRSTCRVGASSSSVRRVPACRNACGPSVRRCCTSSSSGPRARSTPVRLLRSPCTRGCAGTSSTSSSSSALRVPASPAQRLLGVLLDDVRGDAHRAGDLEDDLAGLGGQAQRVQHRGAGEVDVGQPARAFGDEGGKGTDPPPQRFRAAPPPQGLEDDVGPRVAVGVEEVAEPGDPTALPVLPALPERPV